MTNDISIDGLQQKIAELNVQIEMANAELKIQSSLERVRTAAMAMKEPADMLEICKIISHELASLNVSDIRNVQTAIFYEEKGSYMNYEYYAKHDKLFVTPVDYNNHPIAEKFANQMLKGVNQVWTHGFRGQEVKDWLAYQRTTNVFIDTYLETAGSLNYYWYSLGPVALGISTYAPLNEEQVDLFKKFRNVFELAYRRYIDIEKALAQAREAQIEAALEKVRSRSLAMHHSNELEQVAGSLFGRLAELGLSFDGALIFLFDKEKRNIQLWIASTHISVPVRIDLPYDKEIENNVIIKDLWHAIESGEHILNRSYSGEPKNDYFRYVAKYNESKIPEPIRQLQIEKESWTAHLAAEKNSIVGFDSWSGHATKDEDFQILIRFARVFEQAYTRFMDLQKAEAQAREAQIEAALEKIRSSSLAMHRSDEIIRVVDVLFEKLKELGLIFDGGTAIILFPEGSRDAVIGVVSPLNVPTFHDLPYDEDALAGNPILQDLWKARDKGVDIINKCYPFSQKNTYFNYVFKHNDESKLPKSVREFILAAKSYTATFISGKNLLLGANSWTEQQFSDENITVLRRVTRVFEQAYVRFLDLQKAEAQAREAQIELALERVRARAMAMQEPAEFVEVVTVMGEQFLHLDFDIEWANFGANGFEVAEGIDTWNFAVIPGGNPMSSRLFIPWFDHPLFIDANKQLDDYRRTGNDFFEMTYPKDVKDRWLDHLFTKTIFKDVPAEYRAIQYAKPGYTTSNLVLKDTWLSIGKFNTRPFTDEQHTILRRFAKAFGQAHTRFLDLQKAEAQAREAKIEAALEKVRSRSLAMYHSNEIKEVVKTVFEKMKELGFFQNNSVMIILPKNGFRDLVHWTYNENFETMEYNIPAFDHRASRDPLEAWARGERFCEIKLNKEEKNSFLDQIFTYTDYSKVPEEFKKQLYSTEAYNSFMVFENHCGILADTFTSVNYTQDQKDIVERFAKVFEQAYIRFLDLQKAEAQAREAQIEAALEKVRSRSLAMHKSDELKEAGELLWNELGKLGIESLSSGYVLMDKEEKIGWTYAPNPATGKIAEPLGALHTETNEMRKVLSCWKKQEPFSFVEMNEQETIAHQTFIAENALRPDGTISHWITAEQLIALSPKRLFLQSFNFKQGYLMIVSGNRLTDKQVELMLRFTNVFQQTYTRFLDLQKAEAQAREAQIETGLERVRSKTMAMHKSEEVTGIAVSLNEELMKLGFEGGSTIIIMDQETGSMEQWTGFSEDKTLKSCYIPYFKHPYHDAQLKAWKAGEKFLVYTIAGEEKKAFDEHYFATGYKDFPEADKKWMRQMESDTFSHAFMKYGAIHWGPDSITEEQQRILQRFSKVFEQSYTRFLDLKKAEAQAREAQIQLSLERVRAKAMAMYNSDELNEVLSVLFQQFDALGINPVFAHLSLFDLERNLTTLRITGKGGKRNMAQKTVAMDAMDEWKDELANWKASKPSSISRIYYSKEAFPQIWNLFGDLFGQLPEDAKIYPDDFPNGLYCTQGNTGFGYIGFNHTRDATEEEKDIVLRFAIEFGRVYQRFLDLQKAEAQAREAKIEAALEKVRSRTMGMQKSEELKDVIQIVYEQLVHLNINTEHAGFVMDYKRTNDRNIWIASKHAVPSYITIPYFDSEYYNSFNEAKEKGMDLFTTKLAFEEKNRFYQKLFEYVPGLPDEAKEFYFNCPGLAVSTVLLDNVALYIENFLGIPYPDKDNAILMRFGNVFQQTYTRFLDLQKAEAQAREAQIEAALERVRARAMAMHTSGELKDIAHELRKQLGLLGTEELETCVINLYEDAEEEIHALGALRPPGTEHDIVEFEFWFPKKGIRIIEEIMGAYNSGTEEFVVHVNDERASQWLEVLSNVAPSIFNIVDESTHHFKETGNFKAWWKTCTYFRGGCLIMITMAPPDDVSRSLLKRFTQVFGLAYRRFADLKLAEQMSRQAEVDLARLKEEKKRTEEALTELQSTQKQLIQSEKMASLGELTAGIAHEIQNPLNFVNNFSDVSNELLEEMKGELATGNTQLAIEIVNDVKDNLEKILHHGKRADAIVKSMLQHSRTSGGKKEPTDINALAEEYFRLAYHGLRAKDKSFNAKFETDLDEHIEKINIVPQEMGRVILNLINNAFYAVNERKSKSANGYEPMVIVTTKKTDNRVEIKVKDNGEGISQKILDKIFQPFFTTKPTGQGTGLGLSLSYDIVTKGHGGELKVDTKEGEGSEFTISIPTNN